jgi:hypothetical protein
MQSKNLFKVIDISKYNISNFVETGSYIGDGVDNALKNGIKHVYTCDIVDDFINKVKEKFPEHRDNFYADQSNEFLEKILPNLKGNTLFYLDAHFPHYFFNEYKGMESCHHIDVEIPLYEECKTIAKYKKGVENDIIVIDDVDCINDYIGEPRPETHRIETYFTTHEFTTQDLINLFPKHDFIAPFKESDECMYMFFPKKLKCNFDKMGLTAPWYTKDEDWDTYP